MIFFLLSVNYVIKAGSMEILNMERKVFRDTVEVRAGDFFLQALHGVEDKNFISVGGGVIVINKGTVFSCDSARYVKKSGVVLGMGEVVLTRKDMVFSGDRVVYYPDVDTGSIEGRFFFASESMVVNGNRGNFNKDFIVITGRPLTVIDSTRILSDTLVYFFRDSIAHFKSNVQVFSGKVEGFCGFMVYSDKESKGWIYQTPIFITEKDSVDGDSAIVFFDSHQAEVFNGRIVSITRDGVNTVAGKKVLFFFRSGEIDSVSITGNPEGEFIRNETEGKES